MQNGATVTVQYGAVLDLEGGAMDFGGASETARLREESGGRATGGTLTATRELDAPFQADPAGLGIEISSGETLGETTVTRGHAIQTGGGNESIERYYDIAPATSSGLNATLTFTYHDAELNGLSESALEFFRSTDGGSTWSERGQDGRDEAANAVTLSGVDALSRWTLGSEDSPLPVELTRFEAARTGDEAVRLEWETASETQNAGFEVERKSEGAESFETVGFVEGAGTTDEAQSYRYEVEGVETGTHLFRLRQIDRDGAATHSPEIEVTMAMSEAYELTAPYPNPARGRATLKLAVRERQPVTVTLYNALGQRVRTIYDGTPAAETTKTLTVDGSKLSSGLYLVRIEGDRFSATETVTLVK